MDKMKHMHTYISLPMDWLMVYRVSNICNHFLSEKACGVYLILDGNYM